jgi:hypothetical protein
MNIPEEFVTSIESLADSKKFSDAVFQRLVALTFEILIRSKTEQELAGTAIYALFYVKLCSV